MSPEHYQFLTALLRRECGLILDEDKTYLAESRLAPVARQFGREDIDDLIAHVMATAPRQVITAIIDAMVTNETYFFRDRQPFTHFATETLPALIEARREERRLQIWSAAALTGQEAYSLAMILSAYAEELAGWRVSLIGSDISHKAIARAKTGIYSQFEVQRGLPIKQLVRHFEKVGDHWRVKPALREDVQFQQMNLLQDVSPLGSFDAIFCQNVLLYFDTDGRRNVLDQISKALRPDGALYLGGAETITGISQAFTPVDDTRGVYRPLLQEPEMRAAKSA